MVTILTYLLCLSLASSKKSLLETKKGKHYIVETPGKRGKGDYSHEKIDGGKYSNEIKKCLIHSQCGRGEVCTSENVCKTISCKFNNWCREEVTLPSRCEKQTYGKSICVPKLCDDDKDCIKTGANYRCHPEKYECKPSYGSCVDNCGCIEKAGLARNLSTCTVTPAALVLFACAN